MVKTDELQKYWICKDELTVTNKHEIKKSNYPLVFDKVTQEALSYCNGNRERKNCKIGSIKNMLLT